jgi:hypothetical protein
MKGKQEFLTCDYREYVEQLQTDAREAVGLASCASHE